MKKMLIIFCLFFLTTGCWNYNELNTLAIVTSMAIDKSNDEYEVSILIANSKNKESSTEQGNSQTVVYSSKGKTLSEALKNIDLENPRQTYVGHLASIIISEEVAKEGLVDTLDLLFRNSESTKRFLIAIARDTKAKDILKIVSPLESFPAETIATNIKNSSESQAVSQAVVYSDFIDKMMQKGIEPVLPTITIEGDEKDGSKNSNLERSKPKAILKLGTVALFNKDKLITYASKDESRGINLALDKIENMIIVFKCNDDYVVSEINGVVSKIDVEIKDKVEATINIETDGDIIENTCKIDLTKNKNILRIEKDTEKQIKKMVKKGIILAQKEKLDILGIGNLVYKKNPKFYNKIDDWNDYFKDIKINVKVKANIRTKGSSKQSLKEAINGN